MDFNKILVKVKFLDENNLPKGREYTYIYEQKVPKRIFSETPEPKDFIECSFPRYLMTEDGKKVVATEYFSNPDEVAAFADKLKYVTIYTETTNSEQ